MIPEFWKFIESNLNIDSEGIKNIKEVLTLLDYTTIQSIGKLSQKKEIGLIELEFTKIKNSSPQFSTRYPHLADLKFGSGFHTILTDIANKVKRKFSIIDYDAVSLKVYRAILEVRLYFQSNIFRQSYEYTDYSFQFCPMITQSHISMKSEHGDLKCNVKCPKCPKNPALSTYWTNAGQEFRVFNFQRHFEEHDDSSVLLSGKRDKSDNHDNESVSIKTRYSSPVESISPIKVRRSDNNVYWKLCDTNKRFKNTQRKGSDAQNGSDNEEYQRQYLNRMNEERKCLLRTVMRFYKGIRVLCRLRPMLNDEEQLDYNVSSNGTLQLG